VPFLFLFYNICVSLYVCVLIPEHVCPLFFLFSFFFVGKGKKVVSKRESAKEAEEAQKKAAAQEAKLAQVL